ncbi:uncharacterized protein LOC119613726 [Lucilia sericata]|uniref:uncharacterized protein LOC119613726 n=1 Tax=Lucilia sericata TaxID=13632 RepID=UPI0018A81A44|nr:uncharacterized protein LOC119613726 [Lucilia sericata]
MKFLVIFAVFLLLQGSLGQDIKEDLSQASQVANQQRLVRSFDNRRYVQAEGSLKCNFICNPLDVTVCGYNGRCYREFESQCELTIYNCLNTQKIFHIVDETNCQNISFPKCFRGDM